MLNSKQSKQLFQQAEERREKISRSYTIRKNAITALKAQRPDLYARYKLATFVSYRDMQVFCSAVTRQHYCEVRGDNVGSQHAAIFGGTSRVPTAQNNVSPISNVDGGFVFWFVKSYDRGGYETICRIAKPENWAGDEVEAQNWIDFVEANFDGKVQELAGGEDYFDLRRIPDQANGISLLGYSPLSYH